MLNKKVTLAIRFVSEAKGGWRNLYRLGIIELSRRGQGVDKGRREGLFMPMANRMTLCRPRYRKMEPQNGTITRSNFFFASYCAGVSPMRGGILVDALADSKFSIHGIDSYFFPNEGITRGEWRGRGGGGQPKGSHTM
jgi:hypothetical protein